MDSRAAERAPQFVGNFCGGKPALVFVMSDYDDLETNFGTWSDSLEANLQRLNHRFSRNPTSDG